MSTHDNGAYVNQPIPGPDSGSCGECGGWRKAGMTHDCDAERKRQQEFAEWFVAKYAGALERLGGE